MSEIALHVCKNMTGICKSSQKMHFCVQGSLFQVKTVHLNACLENNNKIVSIDIIFCQLYVDVLMSKLMNSSL